HAGNVARKVGSAAPYSKRQGPVGGWRRMYASAAKSKKRRSTSRQTTGYVDASASVRLDRTWVRETWTRDAGLRPSASITLATPSTSSRRIAAAKPAWISGSAHMTHQASESVVGPSRLSYQRLEGRDVGVPLDQRRNRAEPFQRALVE